MSQQFPGFPNNVLEYAAGKKYAKTRSDTGQLTVSYTQCEHRDGSWRGFSFWWKI